eukprot:augustus_masked-scaffold_46-processed-gene-1.111-mRNA-1 protein AED:1.00 eAED:1.00 QI:0/0/0/0/1/1/3/0/419
MLEVISRVASGRFKWKIRASHYFDEAISFAKWGWNCKRLKRCKIKCSSDKNCSFEVNIKLNLETSKYIFVVINENHCNHEVKALGKIKKYAQQLTSEELKMIKHLGVADSGIAAADVALHRNFPGTLFDKTLVKRIMKKAKEGVDASEDNNIKKLITCGKRCLERGGRFDLTWDYPKEGKAILNGLSFQEDLQNKVKKVYGDNEVVTYHENNVDKYMEKTLKKIKDLIREDKDFSKEADEIFTKELKLMGAWWIVEELSSIKFIVSDSNMRVKMKHVLEVVEREGEHALFKQALREMGREVDGPRGCIEFKVKVPPVNAAYIPRKPEAKYSKLLTACKALCEEAKSSNEGWKKSYAAVLKMTAVLRENPDGDFGNFDEVFEESGIMFESPRKRVKRRRGKGENMVSPLDFSKTTLLTDE